jgi:hypothetical protein
MNQDRGPHDVEGRRRWDRYGRRRWDRYDPRDGSLVDRDPGRGGSGPVKSEMRREEWWERKSCGKGSVVVRIAVF